MINACMGPRRVGLLYGLLQMLFAALLLGWVWSVCYGLVIIAVAKKTHPKHGHGAPPPPLSSSAGH